VKNYLKENQFFVWTFIGFFLLSLLFPFSGDDIQWGLIDFSIDMFKDFSTNANLNGRYLGNFFVVIMTKNIFIRGFIMSLVMTLIVKIIKRKVKVYPLVIVLLLLFMPKYVFSQCIVWTSGFTNYVISSLFLLISLLLLEKNMQFENSKVMIILNFVVLFLSSLFVENLTVFLFLLTIVLNIIYFCTHKRINMAGIMAFLGSLLGMVVMFSHPAYHQVLAGDDGYRSLSGSFGEIFTRMFENFKDIIYKYTVFENLIIVFLITILLFIYFYKNKNKYNKIISNIINIINLYMLAFSFYVILSHFNNGWNVFLSYSEIFNIILTIIFALFLIIDTILLFRKSKNFMYLISILLCICGLVAPLMVVWPIGPRNFFMIYMLEVVYILFVIKELNISLISYKPLLLIFVGVLALYYVSIYGYIFLVNQRRENYIKEQITDSQITNIVVPRLPYTDYVWCGDFDNDYLMHLYKIKNNIDLGIVIEFVDYPAWKVGI